jgi:hypothetical protein
MNKRFKQKEITGDKIDETLANNITDLFRNGMDDAQYSEIIKDEVASQTIQFVILFFLIILYRLQNIQKLTYLHYQCFFPEFFS